MANGPKLEDDRHTGVDKKKSVSRHDNFVWCLSWVILFRRIWSCDILMNAVLRDHLVLIRVLLDLESLI